MIALPNGISGRAFAILIGVLVLGTVHLTIVAPLFSYYVSTAQKLQNRQELGHRYQDLARALPRLRASASAPEAQSHDHDLLLTGSTDAVAAAMLQSTLKDLVEREGAKLTSAEMLPSERVEDLVRRVGVRIAFSGNLRALLTVLEGVETTRPVLSVRNLDIHAASEPGENDGGLALTTVMDVYGYVAIAEDTRT